MREHLELSEWRRIVLPVIGLAVLCLGALLLSRGRPHRWLGPSRRGAETPEEAARFVAEGAMADEGGPSGNAS